MSIRVDIDDKELRRVLDTLESLEPMKRGIEKASIYIKGKMADYPKVRRGPMVGGFKSDAQRRAVFAKIREGDIPYRRGITSSSENLANRWTARMTNGGLTGIVGNNASYAQLVHGHRTQAAYHKITGWPTDKQVAESEAAAVERIIVQEVEAAIR